MRLALLITLLLATLAGCVSQPTQMAQPTVPPEPTVMVSPTTLPATTTPTQTPIATSEPAPKIPSPTATVTTERLWQGLPIGLPDVSVQHEQSDFAILRTSASLTDTEKYLTEKFSAYGWQLLESLFATQTRLNGEAVFLRFWQGKSSSCVLVATAIGDQKPTVTVSTNCPAVRKTADNLRTTVWRLPEKQQWDVLKLAAIELRYPTSWTTDSNLFQQPFCKTSGISCLAGLTSRETDGIGFFSVVSRPRSESQTLERLAVEADKSGAEGLPYSIVVATDEIKLNDNRPAVYVIRTAVANNQLAFVVTVYTVSKSEFFIVSGTAAGKDKRRDELLRDVINMALSFLPVKE